LGIGIGFGLLGLLIVGAVVFKIRKEHSAKIIDSQGDKTSSKGNKILI
jgi:hypothetical protein